MFATFASQEDAKRVSQLCFSSGEDDGPLQAVGKLHQLQVLGSRLVVEFAHSRHSHLLQEQSQSEHLVTPLLSLSSLSPSAVIVGQRNMKILLHLQSQRHPGGEV